MPLRVELKPFERIVIGETVIINSGTRTSFLIDGDAPVTSRKGHGDRGDRQHTGEAALSLRPDDVPEERRSRYRTAYLGFLKEVRLAIPEAGDAIDAIDGHVSSGALYKELKEMRQVIKVEQELLIND